MSNSLPMSGEITDVMIIGAGLAGLTCGQELQRAGYGVLILEKSRGLGGRMATRRIGADGWLDHGAPAWLEPQDVTHFPNRSQWQAFTQELLSQEIIQAWPEFIPNHPLDPDYFQAYAAPFGMTTIAKQLAQGLRIERQQQVTQIRVNPEMHIWQVTTLNAQEQPQAWLSKTLILAIPAPQAHTLCQPLTDHGLALEFIRHLAQVRYDPCLTLMLGFDSELLADLPPLPRLDPADPQIRWWAWDSQKRPQPARPVMVLQTTPAYAQANFDTVPLSAVGDDLWPSVCTTYTLPNHCLTPNWLHVHRWRYAHVTQGYPRPYLVAPMSPTLICCGDWCGETNMAWGLGRAWQSGIETAQLIKHPVV